MLKKIFFFITLAVLSTAMVHAQTLKGKVVDGNSQPISAATVNVEGTTVSTATDASGEFVVNPGKSSGKLIISHINFVAKSVRFTSSSTDIGTIVLDANEENLDEVVVVGKGVIDLAKDRNTPIAVSTIKGQDIQDKAGAGDVTQALVNVPSVYVGAQAGGYGDSRISVRGFGQDNTAFLLNGQPINGMEDGLMYWSNWSGMSDIASAIQVQRGLGSSKLAISSVGGTVNFVTKATEMKQGGFASFGAANNEYYKGTVAYNTGLGANGWGVSLMLTHWQGNGYNAGTKGLGQNYFLSVGYRPNDKHQFNLLLTGAPQWHDQNFQDNISDYLKYGRKYNGNWGYLDGEYLTERRNFYHKPVANFNWDFKINESTQLSTVAYASWGRGGGTGNYGSSSHKKFDQNGQVIFDSIYDYNAKAPNGIGSSSNGNYLIRSSMNNHGWYGVVSNLNKELSKKLNLNLGIDLRTYKGTHYRQVANFLGLNGWNETWNLKGEDHQSSSANPLVKNVTESLKADPWVAFFNTAGQEQRIDYDYSENISYGGVFGQLEYTEEKFSTFFQGALSNQSHRRTDFEYQEQFRKSETVNNIGYNVKAGFAIRPDAQNTVYVNAGYYSRQPYHDNIYLNFSNEVNPLTSNEKILGLEAGYNFSSRMFSASLNAYRTSWKDRVTTTSRRADGDETIGGITVPDGAIIYSSNQGVEQVHMGVELDFILRPVYNLDITGYASLGNWEYNGDVITTRRDEDLNTLDITTRDVDGGKVGNAAQTVFGLGARYRVVNNLSLDANWRYYDNLHADVVTKDNVKLPSYDLLDAGVAYLLNLKDRKALRFRVGVNNLLHEIYLSDMRTSIKATDNVSNSDPSAGTYESTGRLYKGIADANQVYFGFGRTWNASVRFSF
ncbi:TonB-dependent receptor [Niabella insulamsoli]|uniref:TonB-dependent receptor n=1 Tax=Niabella insulamsoli TaxID=3144874 RepID=UPI0031FBA361